MADASDLALRNLERMIAQEPLLRDILHPSLPRVRKASPHRPEIDVLESDEGYTVHVAVPGVPAQSLNVQLEGTKLLVTGETPSFHDEGARVKVAERGVGPFSREFLLPVGIDGDRVSARVRDGLLTIRIPRSSRSGPRKVEVEKA